jgi:hypothetical protein
MHEMISTPWTPHPFPLGHSTSASPIDAPSPLRLAVLEHDLDSDKQTTAGEQHEPNPGPRRDELIHQVFHPVQAEHEPNKIRCHHHENVEHPADRREMSIPLFVSVLQ